MAGVTAGRMCCFHDGSVVTILSTRCPLCPPPDAVTVPTRSFGFARFTSCDDPRDGEALTSYVVTRWYRAPEVLLGQEYGPPAGVIFVKHGMHVRRYDSVTFSGFQLPGRSYHSSLIRFVCQSSGCQLQHAA